MRGPALNCSTENLPFRTNLTRQRGVKRVHVVNDQIRGILLDCSHFMRL